jgi:uncharacterized membrane protein YwzB
MASSNDIKERFLTSMIFAGLYLAFFLISDKLDLTQGFAKGISLIYLPAGIKLVAALVGGFWGVLGVFMIDLYLGSIVWPEQSLSFYLLRALIGCFSTLMVVWYALRSLKIDNDLSNLKFIHLPIIDLLNTLVIGLAHNAFLLSWQVINIADFWVRSSAMAFGNFTGSMVVLLSLTLLLRFNKFKSNAI